MLRLTLILCLSLIFLSSVGRSQKISNSTLPKVPTDKNVTNIINSALGNINKFLGTGNGVDKAGIVQTIDGLIKGVMGNGIDLGGLSGTSNKTAGSVGALLNSILPLLTGSANQPAGSANTLLNSLLPLLSGYAQDPSKLIPVALRYLKTGVDSLDAKGVSEGCRNDLEMLILGLSQFNGWAWKMIDSNFKIPSNLAGFNLKWMGDMGECVAIHANTYNNITQTTQQFDGKYCRLLLPISGLPGVGTQIMLLGACASNHCSNNDVKIMVDSVITAVAPKTFTSRSMVSCIEEKELDSKAIAVVCFLAILGTVITLATLYDVITNQLMSQDDETKSYDISRNDAINMSHVYTNSSYVKTEVENGPLPVKNGVIATADLIVPEPKKEQGRLVKAILAFSAYSNACKLLGTSQASGSLGAINGIRFLSMAWVILGHTYYFAVNYASNMADFGKEKLNQYSFMSIIYATPSVDSFFALSGCLVAYLTLREVKKVGGAKKLNWFMFYFHRFWRLTPPYMLVIMVGTILYQYIGNGALKPDGDSPLMASCRDDWWTNLLYINNFAKKAACMGWTWYMANDMQMYIFSPLIFIPLFYNVIIGGVVSALFLVTTVITSAVLTHENEYPVQSASPYAPTRGDGEYFNKLYIPFYTRMGPYIIGLLTGYALYKCNCKFRIPKPISLGCWLLCIMITTLVVYGPYTNEDSHIMSPDASAAYYALFRTAWGVAICWIIFACATGNGGWVNDILSWSPFVPLGRLTYCAYLLHPLVMTMYYENRVHPIYFTDYDTVYLFLGNLALSYGAAFVISLLFESPMMGLEKAIFKKK